jgi:hypothetical protein
MESSSDRFSRAIAAFDAYHEKDPNTETDNGKPVPKELLYAHRMSYRLHRFAPDADESVKLAARCQHIGRWEIPRAQYTQDRRGYLLWRHAEKLHHVRIAGEIMAECGYDTAIIDKVSALLMKRELPTNADAQLLEDVVCIVFIEHYLADFAARHDDEKVVDILHKTMRKMSDNAKKVVGGLRLSPRVSALIAQADRDQ